MTHAASRTTRPIKKASPRRRAPTPDVMTLSETAAYLRLGETEVARLAREEGLPGRQLGSEWRFLKSSVPSWLDLPMPQRTNKAAILAMAGIFKDDPFLDEIVAEAYRQRKRQIEG